MAQLGLAAKLFNGLMGLGMVGGVAAGGANVAEQKKELCKSIGSLQTKMNNYVDASKQTLAAYNQTAEDLKNRLFDLQAQIAETTAKIKERQADFETTYKYSQYICAGIFVGVAFLLYLKHNRVLTMNPFQAPPPVQ